MSPRLKRSVLGIAVFLSAVASAPTVWDLWWHVPGRLDFMLHHIKYERIVHKIKALPLPPQNAYWRGGHCTIDGIPVMYEVQSPANQYSIVLTTADWGHLGHAGYVYSDLPPVPVTNNRSDNTEKEQNGQDVAPHWCTFTDNND